LVNVLFPTHPLLSGMPSHYPSETLRLLAHSSVASNHSILTHSFPNLNIRHLATARSSDSSYMLYYVARYKFSYVCMYWIQCNPTLLADVDGLRT